MEIVALVAVLAYLVNTALEELGPDDRGYLLHADESHEGGRCGR